MNTYIITGTADGRNFTMAITAKITGVVDGRKFTMKTLDFTENLVRELCRARLERAGVSHIIIISAKLEA